MTTSHLNTSDDGSQSARSSMVLIVGGARSGERIKWLGNHVRIHCDDFVLHRVYFTDGTRREYYVMVGTELGSKLHLDTVRRIEVCA